MKYYHKGHMPVFTDTFEPQGLNMVMRRDGHIGPYSCVPSQQFWAMWRRNKEQLKNIGYRVKKIGNSWTVFKY